MTSSKPRILLVEDDALTQAGIRDFLLRQGLEVQSAANTSDALAIVSQWQPDVVVLDIALPLQEGDNADIHQGYGIDVARQIKASTPKTGIVFFSSHPYFRDEALDLSGQGEGGIVYLLKGAHHPSKLLEAIELAQTGHLILDPQVNRGQSIKLAEPDTFLTEQEREKVERAAKLMVNLTKRELEIVHWVAASRTIAGIAQELYIQPSTVQSTMRQTYSKVGLSEGESETLLSKRALLVKAYHLFRKHNPLEEE